VDEGFLLLASLRGEGLDPGFTGDATIFHLETMIFLGDNAGKSGGNIHAI
jgi:hypothetical protein